MIKSRTHAALPLIQPLESRSLLAADLTATFNSYVLPASPLAGTARTGTALVSLANKGDAIPAGTKIKLNVSLRPAGTTGDQDVRVGSLAAIQANKLTKIPGRPATVPLKLPASLPAGNYKLVATVDAANAVDESNESNNNAPAAKPYKILPSKADLAVSKGATNLSSTTKTKTGSAVITNTGNVPLKGKVDLVFVTSAAGEPSQILGQKSNVAVNLQPKQSLTVTGVKLLTPTSDSDVTFNIIARIEPKTTPVDTKASNNTTPAGKLAVKGDGPADNGFGTVTPGPNSLTTAGLGTTLTFTQTSTSGTEKGTVSDGLGHTGTYEYSPGKKIFGSGSFPGTLLLDFDDPNLRRVNRVSYGNNLIALTLHGRTFNFSSTTSEGAIMKIDTLGSNVLYLIPA